MNDCNYDDIVCYGEPDSIGEHLRYEISVLDAIRLQRLYAAESGQDNYYGDDDREALDDFMALHFACFKSDMK